jgi:hypothetical protein
MAPTKFISHMPRKIEYFALYGHMPEWIHRHIHRYGDELCEIVRNVPTFPIKSMVIDAYFGVESKAHPFVVSMSERCQRKGVAFNKPADWWFTEGSRKSHFGRTHDISELDDNKVTPVRRKRAANATTTRR